MASLAAAHKGYFYQDIASAYFLARSLVEPVRSTTVDAKFHTDDRFDDLLIIADNRTEGSPAVQTQRHASGFRRLVPEQRQVRPSHRPVDKVLAIRSLLYPRDGIPGLRHVAHANSEEEPISSESRHVAEFIRGPESLFPIERRRHLAQAAGALI